MLILTLTFFRKDASHGWSGYSKLLSGRTRVHQKLFTPFGTMSVAILSVHALIAAILSVTHPSDH